MKAWGRTEIANRDYKKLFSPIHISAPQSAMERESHSSPSFVSILSFILWFSLSGMYCNVLLDLQSRVTNLSILRWISVAERRRHDHHQRFVLKIDDVVIRHAHDLKRYRAVNTHWTFNTHTHNRGKMHALKPTQLHDWIQRTVNSTIPNQPRIAACGVRYCKCGAKGGKVTHAINGLYCVTHLCIESVVEELGQHVSVPCLIWGEKKKFNIVRIAKDSVRRRTTLAV